MFENMKNARKLVLLVSYGSAFFVFMVVLYMAVNIEALKNGAGTEDALKNIQSILLLSCFVYQMLYYFVWYKIDKSERLKKIYESHADLKVIKSRLKIISIVYGVIFFASYVAKILIVRN